MSGSAKFAPSPQQEAIFDDVRDGEGHTVVIARAGCGKTTTIVQSFRHIPRGPNQDVLMVAFNKSIATELGSRAPSGVTVSTLHSYGFRQIREAIETTVNGDKLYGILKEQMPKFEDKSLRGEVAKLVSLAKGNLVESPESLADLALEYGLGEADDLDDGNSVVSGRLVDETIAALATCKDRQSEVDFDDMIWYPNIFSLKCEKFERVFVDETQDLNAAQIKLAVKACRKNGRILAVGDDRQAIYRFRGAGANAVADVTAKLQAKVLGLTTTYRCGKAIVEIAKKLVPDFSCPETAHEGSVTETGILNLISEARQGDFILSRTNAPLVSLCFRFLAEGKRVSIQGRDIGARLITLVQRAKAVSIPDLISKIENWRAKEIRKLEAADKPVESVNDTAGALLAVAENCDTPEEVIAKLETIFQDGKDDSKIVLSSTHKAKGLERDRVWLLRETYLKDYLRSAEAGHYVESTSPSVEEANLYYVAVTRARRDLRLVWGLR